MNFKIIAIAFALMLSGASVSAAEPVKFTWDMPTKDCAGNALAPGVLDKLEIFISRQYMAGTNQPPCGGGEVVLPSGLPVARQIDVNADSYETSLNKGVWYARIRVHGVGHGWSTLSSSLKFTVVIATSDRPNTVILKVAP